MAGLHATPTAPPMAKACRTVLDFVSWLSHGAEVHGGLTLDTWIHTSSPASHHSCFSCYLSLRETGLERGDFSRQLDQAPFSASDLESRT